MQELGLQGRIRNQLLGRLDPGDFALLQPHLFLRRVQVGDVLIHSDTRIDVVYFPENGIVSYVSPNKVETEIGIVGWEGVAGISVLLGVDRSPLKFVGQRAGYGYGISSRTLLDIAERNRNLANLLYRYIHILMMQAASSAYAYASFSPRMTPVTRPRAAKASSRPSRRCVEDPHCHDAQAR